MVPPQVVKVRFQLDHVCDVMLTNNFSVLRLNCLINYRDQVLELLSSEDIGSFIIRESTTLNRCFALSVKVPKFNNPSGVAHYIIERTENSTFKIKVCHPPLSPSLSPSFPPSPVPSLHPSLSPSFPLSLVPSLPPSLSPPSFPPSLLS